MLSPGSKTVRHDSSAPRERAAGVGDVALRQRLVSTGRDDSLRCDDGILESNRLAHGRRHVATEEWRAAVCL